MYFQKAKLPIEYEVMYYLVFTSRLGRGFNDVIQFFFHGFCLLPARLLRPMNVKPNNEQQPNTL